MRLIKQIMLAEYLYTSKRIQNKQFASYLSNRKQFASLNDYKSNLANAKCGCLKAPYWDLFYFLSTIMIYI